MSNEFWKWVVEQTMPKLTLQELEVFLDAMDDQPLNKKVVTACIQQILAERGDDAEM